MDILQQHILFNAYKRSACCHSFQLIHTQALLIRHCDIITVCEVQFALGGGGNVQQLLPEWDIILTKYMHTFQFFDPYCCWCWFILFFLLFFNRRVAHVHSTVLFCNSLVVLCHFHFFISPLYISHFLLLFLEWPSIFIQKDGRFNSKPTWLY